MTDLGFALEQYTAAVLGNIAGLAVVAAVAFAVVLLVYGVWRARS